MRALLAISKRCAEPFRRRRRDADLLHIQMEGWWKAETENATLRRLVESMALGREPDHMPDDEVFLLAQILDGEGRGR